MATMKEFPGELKVVEDPKGGLDDTHEDRVIGEVRRLAAEVAWVSGEICAWRARILSQAKWFALLRGICGRVCERANARVHLRSA